MLFTNVLKTLVLIALFIAVPVMVINLSRQGVKRLIQHIKAGPHHS